MALPRSHYVKVGQEGVYHCFSRCVRRAFLYGFDALTHRDFSHRKAWLVERLKFLASIFAVDVCAYAVMENHYHAILRTRPDIVAAWSDREVATRWLALCPPRCNPSDTQLPHAEKDICALLDWPQRIPLLRQRLCNLSWFMAELNEFISRAANKEDNVKGRFWESRFQCQALLDIAAIATCMVYVDLNPVRAGLAHTPEQCNFTSIQERIRALQIESMTKSSAPNQPLYDKLPCSIDTKAVVPDIAHKTSNPAPKHSPTSEIPTGNFDLSASWLCPIQSNLQRRGILEMTTAEYLNLVSGSARMTQSEMPGVVDPHLVSLMLRIGANPDNWLETVSHFGSQFSVVAGLISSLRSFADQLGKRWFKGVVAANTAFTSSQPQLA
jgi:hypothetical protein